MSRALGFRTVAVGSSLVVAMFFLNVGIQPIQAAKRVAPAPTPAPVPVELFQAQAEGTLDVGFVPADEKRGMLLLQNRTRQPMIVHLPDELAAVPILAQQVPVLAQQPQRLGVNFPMAFGGSGVAQTGSLPEGILAQQLPAQRNAPPANGVNAQPKPRTIVLAPRGTLRFPTLGVCLDLGQPTPNSRMPYRLVQMQQVSRDPRLAKTIRLLGQGRYDQTVVQAAAWHLSNGKSRQDLAKLRDSSGRRRFNAQQFQLAEQLLAEVSAPDKPATPAQETPTTPAPVKSSSQAVSAGT